MEGANKSNKIKKPSAKPMIPTDALENKGTIVGRFWTVDKPLKEKSKKLLKDLVQKYNQDLIERLIVPRAIKTLQISKDYALSSHITQEINGISLRCLEWLVTNYSKKYKIVLYDNEKKRPIDIYKEYSYQLDHHRRLRFDPFCRHQRIYFQWPLINKKKNQTENVILLTTVGQLNFMRWADMKGILVYARNHQEKIQKDMESTLSQVNVEKKKYKQLGMKRKRKELSKAPKTLCTVYPVNTVMFFDQQFDMSPKSERGGESVGEKSPVMSTSGEMSFSSPSQILFPPPLLLADPAIKPANTSPSLGHVPKKLKHCQASSIKC